MNIDGGKWFFGVLALIFITLKLCNVVQWSWWLVLLPLYAGLAFSLALLAVIALIAFSSAAYESKKSKKIDTMQ